MKLTLFINVLYTECKHFHCFSIILTMVIGRQRLLVLCLAISVYTLCCNSASSFFLSPSSLHEDTHILCSRHDVLSCREQYIIVDNHLDGHQLIVIFREYSKGILTAVPRRRHPTRPRHFPARTTLLFKVDRS